MNIYYVYALLDPRIKGNFDYADFKFSFKPFYVGKGHGNRANDHFYSLNGNLPKTNKIRKILSLGLKPLVEKIYVGLEEKQAYKKEISVIKTIGLDNLTNVLLGGNGVCREDVLGEKNPMFGKKGPKELIAKMQLARKDTLHKYKDCTLEEILGEEQAKVTKEKQSLARKSKSWEKYFGKEKAEKPNVT